MRADLSRRSILKFAAGGSAATLPAVALAAPYRVPTDPVQISDETQLEVCIANLKAILGRMHPECEPPTHGDTRTARGTRAITITVVKPIALFLGNGLYEVELAFGHQHVCHVREYWSEGNRSLWAALRLDGHNVGPRERILESALIRKIGA